MKIKQHPEDFIVEEVHSDGISTVGYPMKQRISDFLPKKKGPYLYCDMVKRNYTSERAVSRVAKALGISRKRILYAGTKDKMALTSQRVCIKRGEIYRLKVKDIRLKNFRYSNEKLKIGDLIGNRFTVTIRDINTSNLWPLQQFIESSKKGVKNYFGEQRFGYRCNNHIIGRRILQGNFEAAVKLFLTDSENEHREVRDVRDWLRKNWGDWSGGLERFPKVLGLERRMLEYLKKHDENFIGAIKKLPKRIALLFVHAYQSYIFNRCLEFDDESEGLPLVGYDTEAEDVIREVLSEEDIKTSDFKVKQIPMLSCKGSSRKTEFIPKDFIILKSDENNLVLRFELSSGTYATVLLREMCHAVGDFLEI